MTVDKVANSRRESEWKYFEKVKETLNNVKSDSLWMWRMTRFECEKWNSHWNFCHPQKSYVQSHPHKYHDRSHQQMPMSLSSLASLSSPPSPTPFHWKHVYQLYRANNYRKMIKYCCYLPVGKCSSLELAQKSSCSITFSVRWKWFDTRINF